jgi:hypothetical protein
MRRDPIAKPPPWTIAADARGPGPRGGSQTSASGATPRRGGA